MMIRKCEIIAKGCFSRATLVVGVLLVLPCLAGTDAPKPEALMEGHEDHSHHLAMMKQAKGYTRSEKKYVIPDVRLVDMNNNTIRLRQLLDTDEPVLLQFIFATCTTICPVLSATFSAAQAQLDGLGMKYRMVSITIDPEEDTPEHLRTYANRFKSDGQWTFLTGSTENIETVERAFKVYASNNKMYHQPYTFLRSRVGAPWVRIEGFTSAEELVTEFQKMPAISKVSPRTP